MPLSPTSTLVIDLLLLSDAVAVEERRDVLYLANKLAHTAAENRLVSIVAQAQTLYGLAEDDCDWPCIATVASRLVREAEQLLHSPGAFPATKHRRKKGSTEGSTNPSGDE